MNGSRVICNSVVYIHGTLLMMRDSSLNVPGSYVYKNP